MTRQGLICCHVLLGVFRESSAGYPPVCSTGASTPGDSASVNVAVLLYVLLGERRSWQAAFSICGQLSIRRIVNVTARAHVHSAGRLLGWMHAWFSGQ
jgi:hypothetical protein